MAQTWSLKNVLPINLNIKNVNVLSHIYICIVIYVLFCRQKQEKKSQSRSFLEKKIKTIYLYTNIGVRNIIPI